MHTPLSLPLKKNNNESSCQVLLNQLIKNMCGLVNCGNLLNQVIYELRQLDNIFLRFGKLHTNKINDNINIPFI